METKSEKEIPGRDEKLQLLALAQAVGAVSFHRLIAAFGSADRVFGASLDELIRACPHQLGEDNFRALVAGPDMAALAAQEETCMLRGVRVLTYRCPDYPAPILTLDSPPPVLYMQGRWLPGDAKALAVVGTRNPTPYGLRAVRELCLPLAQAGWTLVSGLARGIDTLAHECALSAGARTVAVVGTGLDQVYPRENGVLARRVAESGCVIGEFPFGVGPTAWNFPRRNRLISALALGTLVVEAGTDSGALITAEFAVEQGREIFAVPGSIQSPASRGTHYLLREGAHLATCPDDVLSVLNGLSQAAPARRIDIGAEAAEEKAAPPRRAETRLRAEPPEPHRHLLELLSTKAQSLETLAAKAPAPGPAAPRSLLPALLDLEMRGKVRRLPGALYRLP